MADRGAIYIGTSGWSYPKGEGTWAGYFYPAGKVNELEYYSQFFNTVEVNSSFYRPPNPAHVENWVRLTPTGFLFTMKLWQKFTHPRMYETATGEAAVISQNDIDLFRKSLETLYKSGKLGALLAQFPASFRNDRHGQQILAAVLRAFGQYRVAVELRHRSWSDDPQTAELLREYNAAWVQIDEPKFHSSIAADVPLTADIAYFRFHGRNKEDWWTGNSETRYKYLYSQEEIRELAEITGPAFDKARLAFAFFNNHWQGYAPRNAVALKKELNLPVQELPDHLTR
jgi:uncharacterized protein YecE (DUF72 family)